MALRTRRVDEAGPAHAVLQSRVTHNMLKTIQRFIVVTSLIGCQAAKKLAWVAVAFHLCRAAG
jgi:hypothetical protein